MQAFERPIENMSIISFGSCNFSCVYCKRDGQFKDNENNIINAVDCDIEELKNIIDKEISKGNKIRLSGGDPCMYVKEAVLIAQYVMHKYHQKISIAHNGSLPNIVKFLAPYLDYVAIDLKFPYADEFTEITGMANGQEMINRSLTTQNFCTHNGILTDVRTCVFQHTTLQELKDIARLISERNNLDYLFWTIRCYSPVEGCSYQVPDKEVLFKYIEEIKKEFPKLKIGMRARWKGGFIFF